MYCPLKVTSDYSILKSLVKLKDLMKYLKVHNITSCALCDCNMFACLEFYKLAKENDIKPIFGLELLIDNKSIYVYAKNYVGYQLLLKLNTQKQISSISMEDIINDNLKIIIPFKSKELYLNKENIYLGYQNKTEREILQKISSKLVFVNDVRCLKINEQKYISYLSLIEEGKTLSSNENESSELNYLINPEDVFKEDALNTLEFIHDISVEFPKPDNYIPSYLNTKEESYNYLLNLTKKGLEKRLNNNVPEIYLNRLKYELNVITKMGFVDYFLIVYDYVRFAKKNNIFVGPGRGSAAGSLVSYCLGITGIDPIKYNLLFERFLNPERITMPDIDIDFEYTKRHLVIDYVKEKYGYDKVAPIITFGTLAAKQVLRDLGKVLMVDSKLIDKFVRVIDAKLTLKENYEREVVKKFLKNYPILLDLYKTCFHFEGLKRHISTHAAGVVISSIPLDEIIPIYEDENGIMTGVTMEYLEDVGLLKMDFLALRNLTIISNVLELIKEKEELNLNTIPLDDAKVYKLFSDGKTDGVFQFESSGMKNLITKLKPRSFSDLVACIALFRPGPMENIDIFIKRKNGEEKIVYLNDALESILKETWGIIVYQEQIMQILVKMANFTYAEADNIRRAMSKKKKEVILASGERFISQSVANGFTKENAKEVFNLILKFANYGFNKAHSVSYSLIAYQMAYLKAYYPEYFIANLLNMSIGSEIKTKEYLDEAKINNLIINKIDINKSTLEYQILNNKNILLPILVVKNLGENAAIAIIDERNKNGEYKDFFDFVARTYSKGINKLILESLINAGALDRFNENKKTLRENIPLAINYASLITDLDESLVMKPEIEKYEEDDEETLRQNEYNTLGFYLTNHPASKYQDKQITKSDKIISNFDKNINVIGLIEKISNIKTKKNDDMCFITLSDELGKMNLTVFPKQMFQVTDLRKGNLVSVIGKVTKRYAEYSILVSQIKKI